MSNHLLLSEAQALRDRGDLAGASAMCRALLIRDPDETGALHLLGVILSEVGLHSEALPMFERAIATGGADPTILFNYGMTLRALGRSDLAARAFRLAADNNAADIESWIALGVTRLTLKEFHSAQVALEHALALAPDRSDIRDNLALAKIGLGLECQRARAFEDAEIALSAAVALAPHLASAHANLGNVLRDRGRFSEAQACFERALALAPNDADIIANRALALLHAGDFDAAIAGYSRAVAIDPSNEPLQSTRAQALLMAGRFAEGWAAFEHRLSDPVIAARLARLPGSRWRGEDITGRSLILQCEQGLGDSIQFARYVPILAARGIRVSLCGPARLRDVLSRVDGLISYLDEDGAMPVHDMHAALLSVPHLLGAHDIPATIPYLTADPVRQATWGDRLVKSRRRRIGIGWQGNPAYAMDYLRSVPPHHMAALIEGIDADIFILQRGEIAPQLAAAGAIVLPPDVDVEGAFVDTAAIVAHLDLVITSDTALAHLAGALGRPTWILLPSAPDWRWQLRRADCDWYPSVRLFRQIRPGDWAGVVAEACAQLKATG